MASARAMATRCASPPEISRGSARARCPTPSSSSSASARRSASALRHPLHVHRRQPDVVHGRQVLEERVVLEDHAHLRAKRLQGGDGGQRPRRQPRVAHGDSAAIERLERRHGAKHGALAGAREPHQRHQLAAADLQRSTPQSTSRAAAAQAEVVDPEQRRPVVHAVGAFQRCSSRRGQPRQRQRHRQVERRAQRAGHDPAADVRREDLRLLGQLDDGQDRDERGVLEQRDEVVGHRRQRQAKRLRPADEPQHLAFAEAQRARRLELALRHGLERAAVDLALVGGVVQPESEKRRETWPAGESPTARP